MKFFFDNHFPPPLVEFLQYLSNHEGDGNLITCMRCKYPDGDPGDMSWISDLNAEGGWIVCTKDISMRRNPAEREALLDTGITTFYFRKKYNEMNSWEISWRIVKLWPDIAAKAEKYPSGRVFDVTELNIK